MRVASPLDDGIRPRLTQDEKTAETKRRLLDAAIVCLIDRGYANTTTSEIAERAGLSRGAQLYHYPSKEELLTSAAEHLFQLMLAELTEQVGALSSADHRRAAVIDLMWEWARGRFATAWIELAVASRTDAYLSTAVSACHQRVTAFLAQTFRELFPKPANASPDYDLIPHLLALLMEAMALESKAMSPEFVDRILTALKRMSW